MHFFSGSVQKVTRDCLCYIDDILIRSEDVIYIQNSLNYFDGPARDWGLDMNVSKTEVHANGTAPQKEFLTPRGSEFLTYNKKTGRPHTCYKYLGVYLFTCHQAKGLFHMLKADIQSYFARLSPLPLTEKFIVFSALCFCFSCCLLLL